MKININIECEAKEMAALVSSLQERHSQTEQTDCEEISHQLCVAIRDSLGEFYESMRKKNEQET